MHDALDAVEAIADPAARVRAMSKVMADQAERNTRWKKQRRQMVLDLRGQEKSFRQIAAEVGCSLGTVQDILRGYTGSWKDRPRASEAEPPAE